MSLKYDQIENKFNSEGIVISRVYITDDTVVFLELLFVDIAEICFVYVSGRHDIKAPTKQNTNAIILEVSDIDMDSEGVIMGDLSGVIENDSFNYPELNIESNNSDTNKLSNHYNDPIKLGPKRNDIKEELRQIFRQIIRLRQCVYSLDYKFVIVYGGFLCTLRYDNDLQCFWVKKGSQSSKATKLVTYIELESMIEKIQTVKSDIVSVREGLVSTLRKNEIHHVENLKKLLESKIQVPEKTVSVIARKEQLYKYIQELYSMIEQLNYSENIYTEKYKNIKSEREAEQIIRKFQDIKILKQKIITNILNSKSKYDEIMLNIDRICFDNSILITTVMKNFEKLNNY